MSSFLVERERRGGWLNSRACERREKAARVRRRGGGWLEVESDVD